MPRPKTVASTYERFPVRLPKELLRLIRVRSRLSGRPMNLEIIEALKRGLHLTSRSQDATNRSTRLLEESASRVREDG